MAWAFYAYVVVPVRVAAVWFDFVQYFGERVDSAKAIQLFLFLFQQYSELYERILQSLPENESIDM